MKLIFGLLFFTKAQQNDIYNERKIASDLLLSDDSRAGTSSCGLRGKVVSEQCCNDVDLNCYGCHPTLLAMGISCEKQTIKTTGIIVFLITKFSTCKNLKLIMIFRPS